MNKYLKILLLGGYLWYFGEGLFGPLYAVFTERIGGDVLEITGAYSLYLLVSGVLHLIIGKLTDWLENNKTIKHPKRKIMIIGYALNAVATFGYIFVDNSIKLFIIQGILAVAAALATPTWNAIYSKHIDKGKSCEEWGMSDGGPQIVIGIALLLGGYILIYTNFTTLFIVMGCIQTAATIVQARILNDEFKPEMYKKRSKKK